MPDEAGSESRNHRRLARNTISLVGMALAIVAAANILFLFLIDIMSADPNAYVGVLGYMVMPGFLLLGLLLLPVGMFFERRRRGQQSLPTLDLNSPKQR